ncbi:hypothetical protein BZA70DRAFT_277519 [Myxozyma melibiosi]|uniref:Uncharacterized protein n=1 Tax=Myxozyma melibiosi TaxID=54550 RepID=A0ABR1F7Y3_9ASCO
MPVYDVRRRLLRGLTGGSSAAAAAAPATTPSNTTFDSAAVDSSIDTPTARGRLSASPVPMSIGETSFYGSASASDSAPGSNSASLFTPDAAAGSSHPSQLAAGSPPRVRRRLPSRSSGAAQRLPPQTTPVAAGPAPHNHHNHLLHHGHGHRHNHHLHLHKNAPGRSSPSLSTPKSAPMMANPSSILENRGDIIVRNFATNEPEMVYLRTEVPLDEKTQELESREYRVRKHLKQVYKDHNLQKNEKLLLLVQRDLKRIVAELDDDEWMFEPGSEIASDLA